MENMLYRQNKSSLFFLLLLDLLLGEMEGYISRIEELNKVLVV